jgi:uncharacterized heparinase superfamily protein
MKVMLLLRTVRHLRPVQIYGRIVRRLARPKPDVRPAPIARPLPSWEGAERSPSMSGSATFRFLNVEHTPASWDDPSQSRLWRYNLHYFDDLVADGAQARYSWHRELVNRWILENPPASGTGWEPYPSSLRIVNWIKWATVGAADAIVCSSLAVQARWLSRHLEWHILGNHLWANGKALVFAGTFFVGGEADNWLHLGSGILSQELDEQVLADGGHFERSPMYHAIVLEDVLDLINLDIVAPGRLAPSLVLRLRETALRMLRWFRVMSHPDGRLAFFNDAAFGIAPAYDALAAYARRLGMTVGVETLAPLEALPQSGYFRMTRGCTTIICDAAQVGPDYLPGHAHADTLSFELSHHGKRMIVNGGTSTYSDGTERHRQRSTAAHSTVVVDGQNSSEVWAAFRVARRARPADVEWHDDVVSGELRLTASHDGYARFGGGVHHSRSWVLTASELTIEDQVSGRFRSAKSTIHLAPEVHVSAQPDGAIVADTGESRFLVRVVPGNIEVIPSTWHPAFGMTVPARSLVATLPAGHLLTRVILA